MQVQLSGFSPESIQAWVHAFDECQTKSGKVNPQFFHSTVLLIVPGNACFLQFDHVQKKPLYPNKWHSYERTFHRLKFLHIEDNISCQLRLNIKETKHLNKKGGGLSVTFPPEVKHSAWKHYIWSFKKTLQPLFDCGPISRVLKTKTRGAFS